MAFDLFGYNGVFELDQTVVNRLAATFLYEKHLVRLGGALTDGDFFSVTAPIPNGSVSVYLELGRPYVHVQTADGSNLVTLHAPFSAIGVFVTLDGQVARQTVPSLALVVFDCAVRKDSTGLSIDFSKVTADSIGIAAVKMQPGPTGVGGQEVSAEILLDDDTLTNALKDPNGNITLAGDKLRGQLADFIKNGAIGPGAVPLALPGIESALGSLDLLLFGGAKDRDINDTPPSAGADLLLFDVDGKSGQGVRTDATQTLPMSADDPQFTWTLSIRKSVLLDDIEQAFDTGPYYVQGGALNSPSNPLGFLVVPATGSRAGTLPGGGAITVNASQGGESKVDIASGGVSANARARLRNLDRGIEVSFEAENDGSASMSIRADAGERLALTMDAISVPGHSDIIVWRPTLSLSEGQIEAHFHYHYTIPHWCDLEGDATVTFALVADRTKPFAVGVQVLDADASVSWWVYVVAWMGPALLGQAALSPILVALVPTIVHSLAGDLLGPQVSSLAGGLTSHVSAPSPENVALLLDQVDVHETGIQISGRADASIMLGYGRLATFSTQAGVLISSATPASVSMRFDWTPSLTSIAISGRVPIAVVTDKPAINFWSATYDDLPADTAFTRDPFTMFAGDTVMLWLAVDGGHAKVLFERAAASGDVLSTGLFITWVAYRDRVSRAIDLANHLTATVVGGVQSATLEETLYAYNGSIDLTTQKFFLSDETRAIGDEHWFWDDQELTDQQTLPLPGGGVTLDAANRRLLVQLDQSSSWSAGQATAAFHWVKFQGVDVFGNTREVKRLIETPPVTLRPRPIAHTPSWRVDPLGPDVGPERGAIFSASLAGALIEVLTPRVGAVQAVALAQTLAEALTTGVGRIDAAGAAALVTALGSTGMLR